MRIPFLSVLFYAILPSLLISPPLLYAKEPIPVVATLPVLKNLIEAVGQNHVIVQSLIVGLETEHTYTPKPSDLVAVRKAKMLVKIGLGLEIWVDSLIKNAGRPDLLIITSSNGVPLIPGGDPHADGGINRHEMKGNPHIWLDPENVKIMIRHITNGLSQIDPVHQEEYNKNETVFIAALNKVTEEMIEKVAKLRTLRGLRALRGLGLITHHSAWPYFANRFGFEIRGTIQTQVESEPSAKRIGELIRLIRQEKIGVIVSEPQLNPKIPQILEEETGVKRVILSPLPGVIPGTKDYLDFIRYNVETLISTLR